MKVLFVASELTPLAKVGGLGDVIGSLPKALAKIGVDAKIIIPFYEQIDCKRWKPERVAVYNDHDNDDNYFEVYKTRLPNPAPLSRVKEALDRNDPSTALGASKEVEVFLIYNKKYLSRGPIYFEKTAFARKKKEIDRFVFFSRAVYQLLARTNAEYTQNNADNSAKSASGLRESAMSGWRPDIVHCNDWHTGFLAKLLKSKKIASPLSRVKEVRNDGGEWPKAVFTIHNLANQGHTNSATLAKWLGVHESAHTNRKINLMAEGIKNADAVTTVSPTYAKEILTKEYGEGLDGLLRKRKRDLVGILNGIDYEFWPRLSKLPLTRQRWKNWVSKVPRFGFVARLTSQKGLDLLLPLVPNLVETKNAEFWFLGQGREQYEKALRDLSKKYPKNVHVKIGFDEKLAHRIYAESDFFLMPSVFEPSGLGQMIAMHYGTIPIVRATGGLKDTVRHLKTGFVFTQSTSSALLKAINRALQYFRSPAKLAAMRKECLAQDFSWTKSAKKYKKLYDEI